MLIESRKLLYGTGQDRGFAVIELLIVVLLVAILAAVGVPLYLGYIKDAKAVEGKGVVGALWTSVQATAIAGCGTALRVSDAYGRAGLDATGKTADGRWQVAALGASNTLTVNCPTGAYTVSAPDLLELDGLASDINTIKIRLNYVATQTPPAQLKCDLGSGTFSNC